MRVAVIGGGPSGLVTLKYLIAAQEFHPVQPIEARLFESEDHIGGTFRYRVYEDAELVSSKYLTTFSDFRCLSEDPDFLSAERYCEYLEAYTTHFNLWPHIALSAQVRSVRRRGSVGHVICYVRNGTEEEWDCDAIAICSGLHVEPYIPFVKGIENVPLVMHSSEFKQRKDFAKGKDVLVLGAGETAMDLSYLAVTSPTKSVTMCHRGGFIYAPKIVPVPVVLGFINKSAAQQQNIPTDTTVASLFDTAYVHPVLQKSSLLWNYYNFFIKNVFWLISGTSHGCDQWVGGIPDERFHVSSVFLCKSGKAIPYISTPYRHRSLLDRIRASILNIPIPSTGDRTIDLAPWPESISSDGIVHFTETGRPEAERMRNIECKPDMAIFCTGYSQSFPFLDSSYPTFQQADRRGIWKDGDSSVAFIGFVRPALGAIPPLAELQAQLWVLALIDQLPSSPPVDIDYRLHSQPGRRVYESFGVDHDSYAYQLAMDMGATPSFTQMLGMGFKVAFTWAFGPNFNTKFSLLGPWKWEGAGKVMRTELWDVVRKSGGLFYITTYTIFPFVIFGSMSATLYVGYGIANLIKIAFGAVKTRMGRIISAVHSGRTSKK